MFDDFVQIFLVKRKLSLMRMSELCASAAVDKLQGMAGARNAAIISVFFSRFVQSEEKPLNAINLDDRLTCVALVPVSTAAEEDDEQAVAVAQEPAKKQQKTKKSKK